MAQKPQIVEQYERQKAAGQTLYFDPIELDDIFHFYAEENMLAELPDIIHLAVSLHPDDMVTQSLQAEYALNLGSASDCLHFLEPVFTEDNPFFCILKSSALAKLNKLPEAIDLAEKALAAGDDPLIGYDLGLGFMNAEQYAVALRYYSKCLDAVPGDIRTLLGILYCLNQSGSPEEILHYAELALDVDSFCAEAWMAKGGALAELERYDEALSAYDYALAVQPQSADALLMKANCLIQLLRTDEARSFVEEALLYAEGEQRANACILAARIAYMDTKQEAAVAYLWQAVEAFPQMVERVGLIFAEMGAAAEATELLNALYRDGSRDPYVLSVLGETYGQNNEFDKALEVYLTLCEVEPSAVAYSMLGGTYMSMNQFRKAYAALQKAHEMELLPQTCVLLSICAHELRWHTAMQDWYTIAHSLDSDQAKAVLTALSADIAREYEESGVFAEAEKMRLQALSDTLRRGAQSSADDSASTPE